LTATAGFVTLSVASVPAAAAPVPDGPSESSRVPVSASRRLSSPEAADFATANYTGTITLIRLGGCNFSVKAQNAFAAGAIGVVVSNNELGTVPVNDTLGDEASAVLPQPG